MHARGVSKLFPSLSFWYFVFIWDRGMQRVSTCSDKDPLILYLLQDRCHPVVGNCDCHVISQDKGKGSWLVNTHMMGPHASLGPEGRSRGVSFDLWTWPDHFGKAVLPFNLATFSRELVPWVRQGLGQQFDLLGLNIGGFMKVIKSGVYWGNCPVLCWRETNDGLIILGLNFSREEKVIMVVFMRSPKKQGKKRMNFNGIEWISMQFSIIKRLR